MLEPFTLRGFRKEDLKVFRGRLWVLKQLFDEIETERDELPGANAPSARQNLRKLYSELRIEVSAIESRSADLLRRLSVYNELDAWHAAITATVSDYDSDDHHWERDLTFEEARHQLLVWDALVSVHQVIERELRLATTGTPPQKEIEVQNLLEVLLISKDIDYLREHELTSSLGGRRRPDFFIPIINAVIEVKLCGRAHRPSQIEEQIIADIVAYMAHSKRQYFVVYDCGSIRDSDSFEKALQAAVPGRAHGSVCVRVVKH